MKHSSYHKGRMFKPVCLKILHFIILLLQISITLFIYLLSLANPGIVTNLITPSVPKYKSISEFSKSFFYDFDHNYFLLCYIILDEKYTNENAFKTQIYLYILYQVLYNTKTNNYGQSRDKKTLKKSKWTYILGRRE